MYGATHCGDTFRVRRLLKSRDIPFDEVNIDHNPDAEAFVRFINAGNRTTPTLVIGAGTWKTVLSEPDNLQLEEMLRRAGYLKDNTP
jgi:mycoredoxin